MRGNERATIVHLSARAFLRVLSCDGGGNAPMLAAVASRMQKSLLRKVVVDATAASKFKDKVAKTCFTVKNHFQRQMTTKQISGKKAHKAMRCNPVKFTRSITNEFRFLANLN